ncbi:antibiotic biosynthesis monooxygenase [Microvirga sp. 3-52]|nr:antibiotic biosynthesis monooxygenase [Microvirga sp. 3-52]
MAVTYLIKFDVVPDQRDRFLALLNGVLDAMRGEPMFRHAFLHEDPEAANRFMLLETWESHKDVLEVQLKRSYREAWHQALPELLNKPRDVTVWEPLRADMRQA